MEKIPWYQSTTLRALLLAFVSQVVVWTGVAEKLPEGSAALLVDAVLQVVAIVATGYAAWARARRANPPVTDLAVRRVLEREANESARASSRYESGFARPGLLALLAALGLVGGLVGFGTTATFLTGCATFGVEQPKTFEETVAITLAQNAALRNAARISLAAGQLSVEDAEYVLKLTDQSRAFIDSARLAYSGGDLSTAEGRLELVVGILTQVQTYLNSKGVK